MMQFIVGREDGKFKREFAETTLAKAVPAGMKSGVAVLPTGTAKPSGQQKRSGELWIVPSADLR
jgi:hypothetical protein